jgi:hypothetical protein
VDEATIVVSPTSTRHACRRHARARPARGWIVLTPVGFCAACSSTSREAAHRSVVSSSRWGSIMKRVVDAVYTGYYVADSGYIWSRSDTRDSRYVSNNHVFGPTINHRHPMGRLTLM